MLFPIPFFSPQIMLAAPRCNSSILYPVQKAYRHVMLLLLLSDRFRFACLFACFWNLCCASLLWLCFFCLFFFSVCLIICERSLLHRLFIFHFCFLPKLVSPIVLKTNTSYLLFLFLLIKRKERRKKEYKDFLKNDFFPIITNRYKEKYKGSFPSTGNALVNNSLWLLCRKSLEDSYEKMGELLKII